ncbi:spoIID/LytB domain protein [Alistipes sp. CAG:514]|nr:spoIID/LytB domain protein [Alistipes sp. CAG:514]
MDNQIDKFVKDQLSVWPLAAENYRSLKKAGSKVLSIGGLPVTVQLNPCRRISSEASLDKESINRRPCFLCPENRPAEQTNIEFEGRKGRRYRVTLNPYPIFPSHLVISSFEHTPQSIWHRYQDLLDFVRENNEYLGFYNGPESGASAPDHMHFQACPQGLTPLQNRVDELLAAGDDNTLDYLTNVKEARLFHLNEYARGVFVLCGATAKSTAKLFYRLLDCAPVPDGSSEPKMNIIAWCHEGEYRTAVIFRERHRPHNYSSSGADHLAMSPGCADLAGVYVTTREEDFGKLDAGLLSQVVREVAASEETEKEIIWRQTRSQRRLEVGIMSGSEIEFEIISDGAGRQKVEYSQGRISYNGALYDELVFEAQTEATMFAEPSFILYGVTIGVDFHWERKVTQKFAGTLKFIVDGGKVTAVNIVGVEDYLLSVISSEMKASAGLEFLKAHAVISRSWVMAQVEHRQSHVSRTPGPSCPVSEPVEGAEEYIKWFDHDDHTLFDVCADDHCQRYQGLTMAVGDTVRKAVDQTWGLVLTSEGKICDARFSKCCGGRMELFSTCWEDKDYPYLQPLPDTADCVEGGDVFCDTKDEKILSQVLNDYDLETRDFYRWRTEYSRTEVSDLVRRRSGMDFGTIRDLVPVERGPSGRLKRLKVVGDKKTMIIGKELIIRRWLSDSHLKSSAFEVHWDGDHLTLDGSGWGHGVGLCQIGAAVMAAKGYTFDRILLHYYPGSTLERR